MRIPIDWLGEYVKVPKNLGKLTDKLTLAGHMLDKLDKNGSHIVVDLELRGNRADCYSIYGIAREVSALFDAKIKEIELYKNSKSSKNIDSVKLNPNSKYVNRVMMVSIDNVRIEQSPSWMKERLQEYGIDPLNNIVDLTNYVMLETGQPMHAFDLQRIGKDLEIRLAKNGEKIITFQGSEIELTNDDLVWSNGESVLSVAGAIGGKGHSIQKNTKNILLEAASYNQANIRRTVHRHNLLTDAGIRHEKELDPNLVETGVQRYLYFIDKYNWGKIDAKTYDYYPKPVKPWKVSLSLAYLNSLSGLEISPQIAKSSLKKLGFAIEKENKTEIEVLCPTIRTDVRLEEDLVEEVVRLVGYDKIPVKTLSLEIPDDITPAFINQEIDLKNKMAALGFDEIISLPFVEPKYQNYNVSLSEKGHPVVLENRPSPEIEEMRMSIFPNLLKSTIKVKNERGDKCRFFEIGKIYYQKDNDYVERRVLAMSYWTRNKSSYRKYKGFLDSLFNSINLSEYFFEKTKLNFLQNSYLIKIGSKVVGVGGYLNNLYFTEFYLDEIIDKTNAQKAKLWPKYPPQIEDITIKIQQHTEVGNIMDTIQKASKSVSNIELRDIYKNAYTFRISYLDNEKTLTDEDVKRIRKLISISLQKYHRITF